LRFSVAVNAVGDLHLDERHKSVLTLDEPDSLEDPFHCSTKPLGYWENELWPLLLTLMAASHSRKALEQGSGLIEYVKVGK
jgi:hypothetical protein